MKRTPEPAAFPFAAAAAAVMLWTIETVAERQHIPFTTFADYLIEAAFALTLATGVLAVVALRAAHAPAPGWGRLGEAGALLYGLGQATVLVPATVTLVTADELPLPQALFLPGFALWAAGTALVSVGAYRAAVLPRPLAVLLPASFVLMFVLGDAGELATAATWAVVGVRLRAARRRDRAAADHPARPEALSETPSSKDE
ncbi:hypothetical protein [Microtetraspora niveoalba]|uniref:hypothetical protein n=1 Tax=Microtetraspora niveoalba TaxID=46175 RepID=UPI000831DB46|nr:hypothetical protein [Microtetraspora niveoalba]